MNRRAFLRAIVALAALLVAVQPARADNPELVRAPIRRARAPGVSTGGATAGIEDRLRAALRERRVVRFHYRGLERQVQPHALGRFRSGRSALLGWQTSGASRSGPPPGWRAFLLAQIEDLTVTEETFVPRPDCDPEKSGLVGVDADTTADQDPQNRPTVRGGAS